jgi:hypothetical protein
MKVGSVRASVGVVVSAFVWLTAVLAAGGQAPPERQPLAEEVFKNIRVLRGLPVDEFMGTMGVFSAALGMSCEDCHSASDTTWGNYALDDHRKVTARDGQMMASINQTSFGGRQVVTCYTCHRGSGRPGSRPASRRCTASTLEDQDDIVRTAKRDPAIRSSTNTFRPSAARGWPA